MTNKIKDQYLPIAKSVLIIALAALSVFLTTRLWLVNIPNHNFMPYVRARFASSVPDEASDLMRPFRIVQGSGDGYFTMLYSGIDGSAQWQYGESVIANVLENGTFRGQAEIDLPHIFDAPVLIYQYAFNMDSAVFAPAFGQRTSAMLMDNGISHFNAIAVHPPVDERDGLTVFFIGEAYMWEFSVFPTARATFAFYIPSAREEVHHLVATGNGLQFASRLTNHLQHNSVLVTNPYLDHAGQLNLSHIRGQVSHFFANPATINQGVSAGGVYTFNNLSTVVRYLPWDVIEYTSFRTIGRSSPTNLVTDFSAAFAFIDNDPNVRNDFFLAKYEVRSRGERVFWFDYTINNFPLMLTQNWYTGPDCETPLTHPIEVTVDNGRVVRYRRIVHNFVPDPGMLSLAFVFNVGNGELGFPILPRPQMRTHVGLQTMEDN